MANRTVQSVAQEASNRLKQGNPDFRVIACEITDNQRRFIVEVPMATRRNGPLGAGPLLNTSANTKFGHDLEQALGRIIGVELELRNDSPHTIVIYCEDMATAEPPLHGLANQTRGLPEGVCLTLEEIILRNRGPVQLATEWLRRLF